MKRIFIGSFVKIPDLKYEKIKKDFGGIIAGKWIPEKNFHITYTFIGNSSDKDINNIRQVLSPILNKEIEVDIQFSGLGAFPNIYNPRVFFVKIKDTNGELSRLNSFISEKLAVLGYKSDKNFVPHITLKRIKHVKKQQFLNTMNRYSDIDFGSQAYIEVNIIESILTPEGAIYKKLD